MKTWRTSPAKINLFLYVTGRDAKMHHTLQSLFCLVPTLHDLISISPSEQLEIKCDVAIENNIVREALKLCGIQKIKVDLQKGIPIGAGLGGGSSNAATVLLMLQQYYRLKAIDLAHRKIGADVEFFLLEKNAVYFDEGARHEVTLGLNLPILLVWPNFGISTVAVYDLMRAEVKSDELFKVVVLEDIKKHIFEGENHLYKFAAKIEPRVTEVIDLLRQQRKAWVVRMTGSGSACFAIFESFEDTLSAMQNIKKIRPTWIVHSCPLKV